MAFRAAHAVFTNHVAQPAGWFTGWSPSSRPDSEKAWATSTSSWMWPSSATPSPALRHTAQEGRPGARGSPEQERRQGARRGSVLEVVEGQKRRVRLWRSTGGGSWPYMCTAAPLGYTVTPYLAADPLTPGLIRDVPKELAPCTWVITSPQGTDIYLFLQPYTVVLSAHCVLTTPFSQFVRKHICHFF